MAKGHMVARGREGGWHHPGQDHTIQGEPPTHRASRVTGGRGHSERGL